jgi:tetratricopeptide (TPR) repeat protein
MTVTRGRSEPAEGGAGASPATSRYEPVRLLGRGGMGVVHEAVDRMTGRRVALKKILTPDARQQLRFKREFRMMVDLHHPNLVRLFDLGYEDGAWFFTMEIVAGQGWLAACGVDDDPATVVLGPLDQPTIDPEPLLDSDAPVSPPASARVGETTSHEGPRPTARAPRTLRLDLLYPHLEQLLAALEFLHGRGIVHRDLKPSNVLVDGRGCVKVLDFGLACRHGLDGETTQAISRTGAAPGTVAYMAPEQLIGERVTPAADLYALGCMLFQVITGRLPHEGPPAKLVQARLHEPPPRVEHYVAEAPPALREVCRALLERDPGGRPTIDELRDALGFARPATGPAPGPNAAPASIDPGLPFVGREDELVRLESLLARASAGEVCFQLIEGESGIGKSALARQLVRRATDRGALCLRGRCYEREHLPFVAFDRAIDALTLTLSRWPQPRGEPIRDALRAASRIFPALGLLIDAGAADPLPTGARGQQLQAAFDGLCMILEHCQRVDPVVLVLDDLQWSDEESVALLEAILARRRGRILVLGLTRPPVSGVDPLIRRVRALARAHGSAPVIALQALDSGDKAALIALAGRDRLTPAILSGLASRAEGNPLLALQLVDHLALLEPAAREVYLRQLESSRGVIEALVEHFDGPTRRLLQLAATAGGDLDEELLRAASGLTDDECRRSLAALLAARMLKVVGSEERTTAQAPGADEPARRRLDVFHDRIRETVYDALEAGLRRELHRALALALEARHDEQGREVEALLGHWAEAGEAGLCRALALEASARAEAKLAFRRAAKLLRVALEGPAAAEDTDAPQEAARWEHLGDLCEFSAQLDEALAAYCRARDLWEASPRPERRVALLRLQGRIGETLMMAGRIREGRESFDLGLAMMSLRTGRRRPGLELGLRFALALLTLVPAGWLRRASSAWIEEEIRFLTLATRIMAPLWPSLAAELALRGTIKGLRVGDPRFLQRLLATRVLGLVLQGRPTPRALAQARRDLDASEALALALELPFGLEVVMMHRSLHAMAIDTARARRLIEEAIEAIGRRGMRDSYDGAIARALRIMILFRRGDYDEALAAVRHETDEQPNVLNVPIALFYEVLMLAHRGQRDDAARSLARLEACFEPFPPCGMTARRDIARLTLRVAEGRFAEALADARACEQSWTSPDVSPRGDFRGLWLTASLEAALGCLRVGGAGDDLRDILSRARREARELATRGTLDHRCMGFRALALLAHRAGRRRAASRALERALALSATSTSPHRRWLCLEAAADLGRMTLDIKSEAHALAAAVGFAFPPGWQRS